MAGTLSGGRRAIPDSARFDTPVNNDLIDTGAGAGAELGPAAAPFAVSNPAHDMQAVGIPQGGVIDPRAEQASAINLFNDRVMTGIGEVMEQARTGESSNVVELDRSLRGALDGHLETALGAVRDTYVVPASFIKGLKRQGAAAAQNVAGSVGRILAVRRREQHVAGFNALSDGLIRTVRQNPAKLPVALARLEAGVDVARDTVLSAEEAERKFEDGKRALSIAAFTRLAETRHDTVIEAAPRGAFSALGKEDADAILSTAKQARARSGAGEGSARDRSTRPGA